MKKELKIRIADTEDVKRRLLKNSAVFLKTDTSTYTYFHQPQNKILKITVNEKGIFKTVIERDDQQFKIISNDLIDGLAASKLHEEFTVKKTLTNKRDYFQYRKYEITINQIRGVGSFLIVAGHNPSLRMAEKLTGTTGLEVVTSSFDNL